MRQSYNPWWLCSRGYGAACSTLLAQRCRMSFLGPYVYAGARQIFALPTTWIALCRSAPSERTRSPKNTMERSSCCVKFFWKCADVLRILGYESYMAKLKRIRWPLVLGSEEAITKLGPCGRHGLNVVTAAHDENNCRVASGEICCRTSSRYAESIVAVRKRRRALLLRAGPTTVIWAYGLPIGILSVVNRNQT